ncbi:phage tail protein [Maridesulfovibrio sp.]|uniref:phage tail protein n=1 Tax=Maridesulfovibrio sp. TaxID=2795000 RepID=UPI0029CA1F33|nr:phage tail protein [Maridesulfovibrio sp.]
MASRVMMKLGDYKFSMITAAYDNLERTTSYRWAKQERISREPARQYVGPGDDVLELSGVIYPQFLGGLEQLNRMRAEAGKGKPLMLVDGRGKVWGKYCIEEVHEGQAAHFKGGAPKKQQFSMRISKYGEDAK